MVRLVLWRENERGRKKRGGLACKINGTSWTMQLTNTCAYVCVCVRARECAYSHLLCWLPPGCGFPWSGPLSVAGWSRRWPTLTFDLDTPSSSSSHFWRASGSGTCWSCSVALYQLERESRPTFRERCAVLHVLWNQQSVINALVIDMAFEFAPPRALLDSEFCLVRRWGFVCISECTIRQTLMRLDYNTGRPDRVPLPSANNRNLRLLEWESLGLGIKIKYKKKKTMWHRSNLQVSTCLL